MLTQSAIGGDMGFSHPTATPFSRKASPPTAAYRPAGPGGHMGSTFLVSDRTINRIATWFDDNENLDSPDRLAVADALSIGPSNPNFRRIFGLALFAMNVAAVVHRYGQAEAARMHPHDYHFQPTLPGGDVRVYKGLCCLLYQCSEGDIPETKLFQAVSAIRWKLAHEIIGRTAEYREAAWE